MAVDWCYVGIAQCSQLPGSSCKLPVSYLSLCKTVWPLLGEVRGVVSESIQMTACPAFCCLHSFVRSEEKKSLSIGSTQTCFRKESKKQCCLSFFDTHYIWGDGQEQSYRCHQIPHTPNSTLNAFVAIAERLRTAAYSVLELFLVAFTSVAYHVVLGCIT